MKRLTLVCLLLSATLLSVRAADPTAADQAEVLRRSAQFDTAVRDRTDLRAFVHRDYTYIEPLKDALAPVPTLPDLTAQLANRLNRDACFSLDPLTVTIVGPTAIVTGSYEVVERGSRARQHQPRLVLRGRFTETWIKPAPTDTWVLLAEHRSLHDTMTWASSLAAADVDRKTSTTQPLGTPEPPTPNEQRRLQLKEAAAHRGFLPPTVTDLFRSYESTSIGYTSDHDDDSFMDFSFSAMFPLWAPDNYPANVRRHATPGFFPHPAYSRFNIYGAATIRAGQYIGTRPSSPVVGKRFNPLVAARLWALDGNELASEDNFLEFVYAHESNGQFIANKARFDDQTAVYRKQALETHDGNGAAFPTDVAGRSARDNISRGWDYVGVNFSRDWDTSAPPFLFWITRPVTNVLNAKFNYFLPYGLAQKRSEEFNDWEPGAGHGRKYYDGLSFRYSVTVNPDAAPDEDRGFVRRYSLTWTTGYYDPARFNTFKAEWSFAIFNRLPLTVWFRYGYNRDLVDYYVKDHSFGLSLSYWNF